MRKYAFLLAAALWLGSLALAQSAPPPAAPAQQTQAQRAPGKQAAEQGGPSSELAQQSREAAGEENAEFKQSPSVRVLAKITGLSMQAAYWLAIGFNFLVIALAVGWLVKSNLPAMFRNRTQTIRKTMEEARLASEDANRRLSEIESRLAKLDSEIAVMRATSESEAAAEEERIREAAEADTRKVIEAAEGEIEAAARLAQRELKAFAAELAVSLAEKRIQVDASTDHALVRSFTRELGVNGEGK